MSEQVTTIDFHDGKGRRPILSLSFRWQERRRAADPQRRAEMDAAIAAASLYGVDGEPMSPVDAQRVRDHLTCRFEGLGGTMEGRWFGDREKRDGSRRRWLLEGLWPDGTIPLLSGNAKAGKTTVVADLVTALADDRQFLGRFPRGSWTSANGDGWVGDGGGPFVYLVNAETPSEYLEESIREAADGDGADLDLLVDDLEEIGGPTIFDLTDPAKFDLWQTRMTNCEFCDGSDNIVPDVVIVDGLTAILANDVSRYAEWYAAFRRLMRAIGTPNALVVGHSTQAGGHSMGGVEMLGAPDGLWTYSAVVPDNPDSRRYFQVQPRMGGAVVPRTEIRLLDGRLVAVDSDQEQVRERGGAPLEPAPERDEDRSGLLAALAGAGVGGIGTVDLTGRGRTGDRRRKVLLDLADEGLVVRQQRGRTVTWWAAEHAPASAGSSE